MPLNALPALRGALAVAMFAAAFAAQAQAPAKIWRVGIILPAPPLSTPANARWWEAFRQRLQERGYVEGRNLAFEQRYLEGKIARYPEFAAELVRLKVDVIVVATGPGVQAAKQATASIPIVMSGASDPVGAGLVASLAHPGGNVTGIADYQVDLLAKRLELLKATAPGISRVAFVFGNFGGFSAARVAAMEREHEDTARALGMSLVRVQLNTPQDFAGARAAVLRERADALLLSPNPTNLLLRHELADFALRERLPTIAARREEALAGALMSYGPDLAGLSRMLADYVARILGGANPGDLPVEQPTKFELVVNLKTAKALGIAIPASLLQQADEVLQ